MMKFDVTIKFLCMEYGWFYKKFLFYINIDLISRICILYSTFRKIIWRGENAYKKKCQNFQV